MKKSYKATKMLQYIIENTTLTRVLSFLSDYPDKTYTGTEIAKKIGKTRMSIFLSLKILTEQGLIEKDIKGKTYLYKIISENPVVKYFKILKTVIMLESIIKELKSVSKKIVLYGSASRGEDTYESDIDLLIITNNVDEVKKHLQKYKFKKKIETKIFTSAGFADLKSRDQIFYEEIDRGITLWEKV